RLTLREITLGDVEHIYTLDFIPKNARYQTWPPRTRDEATNFVHQNIRSATESPRVFVEQTVLIPSLGRDMPPTFIGRVSAHINAAARTAELWFSFNSRRVRRGEGTRRRRSRR
ncbi:hypothetical protein K438DRAFT_2129429, partial [Mycena galopus ATCC 62051]